ncbi:hypothetical protein [Oceanobacillus saliphilus]|uniref:hypothetical protein n=1 Tax=Oceanobacillus saliphilus TaxID=2925834 RepID=UPI00201E3889|nr:hypothetical protein [Oceanobacillus saliphilus]
MRKRPNSKFILLTTFVIAVGIVIFVFPLTLFSPSQQAKNIVNAFYTYEQEAAFTESWELLHPLMQERWSKTAYITDRAHVFMGHFGVETFEFAVEDVGMVDSWKMTEDSPVLKDVYIFNVVQTYEGKYGKFHFSQAVYVVETEDSWRILWDYSGG